MSTIDVTGIYVTGSKTSSNPMDRRKFWRCAFFVSNDYICLVWFGLSDSMSALLSAFHNKKRNIQNLEFL